MGQRQSLKAVNDLTFPHLGQCPEKTNIQKGICTPTFTAALLTIAKTQNQQEVHQQAKT